MDITEPVPVFANAHELRGILNAETTSNPAPRSQFRLEDVRKCWTGTDRDLHDALVRLVEDGEISLFPLGDVVKIKPE